LEFQASWKGGRWSLEETDLSPVREEEGLSRGEGVNRTETLNGETARKKERFVSAPARNGKRCGTKTHNRDR